MAAPANTEAAPIPPPTAAAVFELEEDEGVAFSPLGT